MPHEATVAADSAPESDLPASAVATRPAWSLIAASVGAGLLVLTSIVVVILTAGRGFDLTDEGFYLLSYRWWNDNYDNFTGAQYFMGPVFELLGFDIARFRIFRILALVSAHAFFGLCFMSWLRTVRPFAPPSRLWNYAGAGAIATCAPAVYTWLPLSLGYNDLALICSLGLAGCALRIARDQELDRRVAWWAPFGVGAVAVVLVLSKWSSSLVVLLGLAITLVTITATRRVGIRAWLRLAAGAVAGVATVVGLLQFVLVPLGTLLPPLLEVNRLVASSTNSPTLLLQAYLDGFKVLGEDLSRFHWPLLLVGLVAPFLRRAPRLGVGVVVLAVAASAIAAVRNDGLLGGTVHLQQFAPTLYAPIAAALVLAAMASAQRLRAGSRGEGSGRTGATWQPRLRQGVLLTMIAGMPFAQAAGTGNGVHLLAAIGVGFWMAVIIHLFTGLEAGDVVPRALAGTLAGYLAVATTAIAASGLWDYPYRTSDHAASTSAVEGVPALDSVRLSAQDAADFTELHARVERYVTRPGRPMIAFDRLAGLVLALDGRPVGESWYSVTAPERARQGIVRTCEAGPWWGPGNKPLVFFNRAPTEPDLEALETCGIRITDTDGEPTNYRHSTMTFRGVLLHIYVPMH